MSPAPDRELSAAAAVVSTDDGQGEQKASAYWELGRLLHARFGARAGYGDQQINSLATDLGLLPRTLYRARRFYQRLPNLTTWSGLSWSHCRLLVTIEDDELLQQMLKRARDESWSVRRLQEQIQLSRDQESSPRRGRPFTYQLRPGPCLDVGFGIRLAVAALEPLTDRARRLVDSIMQPTIVEYLTTSQGVDLRPVWGAAHQRLYTYPVREAQVVEANRIDATLVLGPDLFQRRQLQLRGVPARADGVDRLRNLLAGIELVAAIHQPGPPCLVDLFGSAGAESPQQIAAQGQDLNQAARELLL